MYGWLKRKLEARDNIIVVASIVVLVLMMLYYVYAEYMFIDTITRDSLNKSIEGYISDEIWYVDASRNILYKVFGVEPSTPCGECYTIFIHENSSLVTPAVFDIVAQKTGVKILDRYVDTKGRPYVFIYVKAVNRSHVELFIDELEDYGIIVRDYVRGWIYGKAREIDKYLNTEHPPVAKYFISLSMLILGDHPISWRIPSLIAGLLVLLLTYVVTREILKKRFREYSSAVALVPVLLLLLDPIHKYMSSIALLDIYVAASTLGAFYVFIKTSRVRERVIATCVASTLKFTALFIVLSHILDEMLLQRSRRFSEKIMSILHLLLGYFIVFLLVQILVSIPLILHLGFLEWFNQAIPGAFRWHTSIKHEIGRGPVVSTPLDWILGRNSFVLYYWSNGKPLLAMGLWTLYLVSVLVALFLTPLVFVDKTYRKAWLGLVGVYGGYIVLWIIGGRTQYSYYLVQLAPFFHINLVVGLTSLLPKDFLANYKRGLGVIRDLLAIEKYSHAIEAEKIIGLSLIIVGVGLSSILHAPWIEPRMYSDVYSIYWMIYGSPEYWFKQQLTYGVPYIDYRFPYVPGYAWIFMLTTMTRLLLGYDKYLGIDKGFYAYYMLNTLVSLVSAYIILEDMITVSSRFSRARKTPLYLYAILPSMVIYGVYSWDIVPLMFIIRSFKFFIEGKHGLAGLLTGLAALFNPVYSILLLLYISESSKYSGQLVKKFLLSIVIGHSILLVNPGSIVDVYGNFFGHYIEGSWLLLIAVNPSDQTLISLGWFTAIVAGLAVALSPKKTHGYENVYGKLVLMFSTTMLLSPLYKPQYNLLIATLWIPAIELAYIPLLALQDLSASMVILTWFTDNPMHKYSIPQLANYSKCILLAMIIMYNIGKYIDLSRVLLAVKNFREKISY